MDKEFEFSTGLTSEWEEIVMTLNLGDALEYYKDSQDKILFAILDINFFYYILDKEKEAYREWNDKLFENKSISNFPANTIEFCGQYISSEILLNKICMNFFTSLHSFFDNYAHFLHLCLFPDEVIPKKLYFGTLLKKINQNNKFGNIYNKICGFKRNKYYNYIIDIDNINKHRSIVSPQSTIWLNDGAIEIEIPEFSKDGANYSKEQMVNVFEDSLNMVNDFCKHVTREVFDYLEGVK